MAAAGRHAAQPSGPSGPERGPAALFRDPLDATIEKGTPDHLRLAIRLITGRPELRPLCAGVRIALDPALELPFCAPRGDRIVLHPDSLAHPQGGALIVRHALELALWHRLSPPEHLAEQRLARARLVGRVAARYAAILPAAERAEGFATCPDWLAGAYRTLAGDDPDWQRLPAELLRLDGLAGEAEPSPVGDALMKRLQALAAPSEQLLLDGGGGRLRLDPATGRSPYGCGALPEPDSLAFASSTASTISAPAYRAVEALRQELIAAGLADRLSPALDRTIAAVRRGILEAAAAADLAGTEVVLTPSGTDGEYAALHLARRRTGERLVNILIAPEETGRGLRDAARGLHFASDPPAGAAVVQGRPLDGLAPESVTVETIEIRAPDGTPRQPAAVDAEVRARALRAVARGARCLVHRLEGSKSGLSAPSLRVVQELTARHGGRLEVVVDACQLRARPEALRGYLEAGWMVLLTGSKFAMGPPFSGALLVPGRLAEQAPGLDPLPAGYGRYFTRPEWPDAWQPLTEALPAAPNLGLLLRWHAALFELQAYRALPEAERARIVERLGGGLRQAIAGSAQLEPIAIPAASTVEPATTIFAFHILQRDAAGRGRPMDVEAARRVWRWLREDLSERLPAGAPKAERRLAALICEVGQPIQLGSLDGAPLGALRICIGARQVAETAFDPALGKTDEQRLRRQIGRARVVIDKIELIARHFDHLDGPVEAGAGIHPDAQRDAGPGDRTNVPAGAGIGNHPKAPADSGAKGLPDPPADAGDHADASASAGIGDHTNAPAGTGDHPDATAEAEGSRRSRAALGLRRRDAGIT